MATESIPAACENQLLNDAVSLFTFSTLQLGTHAVGHVVGRVTLEAVSRARAEPAVVRAALAAPLFGVVEGLGAGVQTLAFVQVTLQSKLIWRRNRKIVV